MTLILSCLTPEYVVQISDKRLTRDGTLVDDQQNKGTLFRSLIAFAFTGIANLDGIATDHWLANALVAAEDLESAIHHVAELATKSVATLALKREHKHLAFVGAGFCHPGGNVPLSPCYAIISNFVDANGIWQSEAAPKFQTCVKIPNPKLPFCLYQAGVRVSQEIMRTLAKKIGECLKDQQGPLAVMYTMAEEVRNIAKDKGAVGRNLLGMYLPKRSVSWDTTVAMTSIAEEGVLDLDVPTFLHFPSNGAQPFEFSPWLAGDGVARMSIQQHFNDNAIDPMPPTVILDEHNYHAYLLTSADVASWVRFIESLGIEVGPNNPVGFEGELRMLEKVGKRSPREIDSMLRSAAAWVREPLEQYYAITQALSDYKVVQTRNGLVAQIMVMMFPNDFTALTLEEQYGWPSAEQLVALGKRYNQGVA